LYFLYIFSKSVPIISDVGNNFRELSINTKALNWVTVLKLGIVNEASSVQDLGQG